MPDSNRIPRRGNPALSVTLMVAAAAYIAGCASGIVRAPSRLPDRTRALTDTVQPLPLPDTLPFSFTRTDTSPPISSREVRVFTSTLASLLRSRRFFEWILETSYGMHASASEHDFMVWFNDRVQAVTSGDTVTFRQTPKGRPDNIMIPSGKVLGQAAAAYLLTGDSLTGAIVEQYSKGISAQFKAMVWDSTDSVRSIMARAVIPFNHTIVLDSARVKRIDYSAWHRRTKHWNSETIRVRTNPFWGDIWIKNLRSKDDLPHVYRAGIMLEYVSRRGAHERVRGAAREAQRYLVALGRDIIQHGYKIRTKDRTGEMYIPEKDLASFVAYDRWSRRGECPARLTFSLYAYGRTMRNNCRRGYGTIFDAIAPRINYYNLAIQRGFHMTATLAALTTGHNRAARGLLRGLADRADNVTTDALLHYNVGEKRWRADAAVFLLQAAACGLPLKADEVRFIHTEYSSALARFSQWEPWDLWNRELADGVYDPRPSGHIGPEDIGFFYEYCFSPFRNPDSSPCVDCDLLLKRR